MNILFYIYNTVSVLIVFVIKEYLLNVVLLSGDNVCDKEVSVDCVSVIPGIVVGLAVGLNTDGYGSQQRYVLSSL